MGMTTDQKPVSLHRQPDFLKLWAGQGASAVGSQVTEIALPLTAVLFLHASAGEMGLLNVARWLPFLLFTLIMGVYADRLRRLHVHHLRSRCRHGRGRHDRDGRRLTIHDGPRLVDRGAHQGSGGRADHGTLGPAVMIVAADQGSGHGTQDGVAGEDGLKQLSVRRTDPGCRQR